MFQIYVKERRLKMLESSQSLSRVKFGWARHFITSCIMLGLLAGSTHLSAEPTQRANSQRTSSDKVGVPHPFFWEVTGPQGARAHFIGTMHVPDERWERFPGEVLSALDRAEALYTEIDLRDKAEMSSKLLSRAMLQDKTLQDMIGASLFNRIDRYLKKRGQSASFMNNFHPKMVEMTLGLLEIMPLMQSGKPALDDWLMKRAEDAGKIVGGVETIDEQLDALLGGTAQEAISSLEFTIAQLEEKAARGEETFKLLLQVYFSGDAEKIDTFMKSELEGAPPALFKSMDRLLRKRNVVMAKRVMKLLDRHPKRRQVFAFGVAHFVGKESVVELMRARGYQIKRRFAPPKASSPASLSNQKHAHE